MKYRLKKSSRSKPKRKLNFPKEDFWVQFNRVHNKHLNMSVGEVEVKTNEKED
jgi:hypothetical protein